jgi:hypothetical protein
MNFEFTEEQIMLRDSVARLVQDDYDFDTRRAIVDSGCRSLSLRNTVVLAGVRWMSC